MNFEKIRKEKKLTQIQVANDLNITQATLSSYETGRTQPDLSMLLNLSKYYNVSIDELLGNERFINLKTNALIVPEEKKQAVQTFLKLPEEFYNNVCAMIDAYAKVCQIL